MTIDELRKLYGEAQDKLTQIHGTAEAESRDLTEDEATEFAAATAELKSLRGRIERAQTVADVTAMPERRCQPKPGIIHTDNPDAPDQMRMRATQPVERTRIEIPSGQRHGKLRGYTRELFGDEHEKRAYTFGRAFAAYRGHPQSQLWCRDHGIEVRVHTEGTNWSSGVFVLDEFDSDLIRLVEQYGVFRQYARNVPMSSDTKQRNRRTGGLTAYAVGENATGTESTMTHDQITLTAKKWMILATLTSELNEDAIISMADELMTEIAWAFAKKEDQAGFIGDGTSTYNGIVGLQNAFVNLGATVAQRAGQWVQATGSTWGAYVLADFNSVVGLLPEYADTPNVRWFMHKTFWGQVASALAYAAGGNTTANIAAGVPPTLLGYPVVFSQVLPKVTAVNQIDAYLGDLNLAADFGDRRGATIQVSDTAVVNSVSTFENDLLAVKATNRYDINIHDVGNYTSTAADEQPGPIVCLSTDAS